MSTIKLREVNAIGATPKEFEIDGDISSQNKMYKHTIIYQFGAENLILEVISSSDTKLDDMKITNYFENTESFITYSTSSDCPVVALITKLFGEETFIVRAKDLISGEVLIDDIPFSNHIENSYSILEL